MTNIKLNVVCLPSCEALIKKIFYEILVDYCERFSVLPTEKKVSVSICMISYPDDASCGGSTIISGGGDKIIVQMRDTYLNDWEDNQYTLHQFANTLCHEFVHVCQHLTGRSGFKIPKVTFDKKDPREVYYFDSYEVEARALADLYVEKYANKLI